MIIPSLPWTFLLDLSTLNTFSDGPLHVAFLQSITISASYLEARMMLCCLPPLRYALAVQRLDGCQQSGFSWQVGPTHISCGMKKSSGHYAGFIIFAITSLLLVIRQ